MLDAPGMEKEKWNQQLFIKGPIFAVIEEALESKACSFLTIVGDHCGYRSLPESVEWFLCLAVIEIFQETGLPESN